MLMATLQSGFTIFSLVAGILSDYFRRERILFSGCLLLGLSSMFFCSTQVYLVNITITFFLGAGIGCILSGSNTLLVGFYPEKKGAILNIHHVFFGLGSFLGPLLMGYLITRGNWWREGFAGQSVLLLLLGVFFLFSKTKSPSSQIRSRLNHQIINLLSDKHFWVILLVNALSMGAQVTILLLGVTFLIEAKQCSLAMAGVTLSVFSVCMMLGRLLCSRLTITLRHSSIVLTLLWLQLATLGVAWYFQGWFAIISLALSGFSFSGIYPTSLALTSVFFPRVPGSALGILSTMGGFGSALFCWLTAYVASLTDMESGFIVLILACFIAVLLFQINHNVLCQREYISIADKTQLES